MGDVIRRAESPARGPINSILTSLCMNRRGLYQRSWIDQFSTSLDRRRKVRICSGDRAPPVITSVTRYVSESSLVFSQ